MDVVALSEELGVKPAQSVTSLAHGLAMLLTRTSLTRVPADLLHGDRTAPSVDIGQTVREGLRFSKSRYIERESVLVVHLLGIIKDHNCQIAKCDATWCSKTVQNLFGIDSGQLRRLMKQHPNIVDAMQELYRRFPVDSLKDRVSALVTMVKKWKDSPERLAAMNYAVHLWIQSVCDECEPVIGHRETEFREFRC